MKKFLNNNLYRAIIDSEFFLSSLNPNELTQNTSSIFQFQNKTLTVLNVNMLLKSIKQFIKLFSFTKKNNLSCLTLQVDSFSLYTLLRNYFEKYPTIFLLKINFKTVNKKVTKNNTEIILNINNKNIIEEKKIFSKGFFIICYINRFLKQEYNSYKINNDIVEIKKVIFLITLLEKIFKK
jgi:hypothetical protein